MTSTVPVRRRRVAGIAAAGLAVAATAAVAAGGASASSPDGEFTVAVVLPSAANDLAFSQSMVDSLGRLKDDGTIADFAMSENMFVVEDAATAIRDYAEQGYDLVIAHGSQYGSSLEEIAPDFPDTAFAWGTAADTFGLPNVSGYTASADQGGYVNGAMAAMLAGDGSLGVIGPIEVGDGKLYVDGFKAGALSVDPAIEVGVNYTESFSDTALAAEAATSFIDGGATALSGTAQMTVGAIGVAKDRGVLWFGTNSDQAQLAPDIVVASQVYHWEVVLAELVASIEEGTLGGSTYDINLGNGGEVIEFNPDFDLPDDVRAAADELIAEFASGDLETGVAGDATASSAPLDSAAMSATTEAA
jgi:basic membrane protein A and related proteins